MDLQKKIEKLTKKAKMLTEKLNFICPKIPISRLRQAPTPVASHLSTIHQLESLTGKVYSLSWGGFGSGRNPEGKFMLAAVTDEGELTIYNTENYKPMFRANIMSEDPWLMTCAFEHRDSSLISAAGSDGKLYLYRISISETRELTLSEHPQILIQAHSNYISRTEFLTCLEVLTTSGDKTCKLWSLKPSSEPIRTFESHKEDIMSLATTSVNPSIFLTGSCDSTIKLWDIRIPKANTCTFYSHYGHVNALKFFNDSEFTFVQGSSAGACLLYDIRTLREISIYYSPKEQGIVCDIECSKSGRMIIAGYDNGVVKAWDVFDERVPIQVLAPHNEQITAICISPLGDRICTSSQDYTIAFLG